MRLARILGVIGRGLISAGVIVLLFVAYQLWGTGLQESAAQGDLGNALAERTGIDTDADAADLAELARANQAELEARAAAALADGADPDGTPPAEFVDGNFDETTRAALQAELYPPEGEPLARIVIPAIDVDKIVVEGVSVEDLRKGPGHYRSTPNPGQAGNAAIAGHRTTYGAPFHRIDELQPGDSIFVTTAQGSFHYQVIGYDETGRRGGDLGYFIVDPSQTEVLEQGDENILTLTACHPKYSARQRIIVQAELVGKPAPTIPRDEAADMDLVTLDSGASDEAAGAAAASTGEEQVIGDDVAADDDPTVDANGQPIDEDATDEDATDDGSADTADDGTADLTSADDSDELAADAENIDGGDFGEGLDGDPTKVKPAIMWGLAGLSIWSSAWFVGKQLGRKWTLYAIGFVPFALVLWSTFVNVDQALPSY